MGGRARPGVLVGGRWDLGTADAAGRVRRGTPAGSHSAPSGGLRVHLTQPEGQGRGHGVTTKWVGGEPAVRGHLASTPQEAVGRLESEPSSWSQRTPPASPTAQGQARPLASWGGSSLGARPWNLSPTPLLIFWPPWDSWQHTDEGGREVDKTGWDKPCELLGKWAPTHPPLAQPLWAWPLWSSPPRCSPVPEARGLEQERLGRREGKAEESRSHSWAPPSQSGRPQHGHITAGPRVPLTPHVSSTDRAEQPRRKQKAAQAQQWPYTFKQKPKRR